MYSPTPEEIAAAKSKHGKVFKLTVEDKCCLMKTPDRKVLAYAAKAAEKSPLAFNEAILNNCFIAGDEEIKKDDAYFMGAAQQLDKLIQVKESELEEL